MKERTLVRNARDNKKKHLAHIEDTYDCTNSYIHEYSNIVLV